MHRRLGFAVGKAGDGWLQERRQTLMTHVETV